MLNTTVMYFHRLRLANLRYLRPLLVAAPVFLVAAILHLRTSQGRTHSSSPAGEISDLSQLMPSPCKPHQNRCISKVDAQTAVMAHINQKDVVLEFGGRYGTTTCAVAVAQNNSGHLVSVEPDPRVWYIGQVNKMYHNCASYTVHGAVGSQDISVIIETAASGYNTHSHSLGRAVPGEVTARVGHYTWTHLESLTGLTFNTVIFDCEGCYYSVVREHRDRFLAVDKVILEYDMPIGPDSWRKTLETIRILQECGLSISPESVWGLDNIRREETGDMSISHIVACQYVFLR